MWLNSPFIRTDAGRHATRLNPLRRRAPRRGAPPPWLEQLEDRIVPEGGGIAFPVALRNVPYAFGPLVTGRSAPCEGLRLPTTLDALDEEGWVWVDPARKYRDVTGVVSSDDGGSFVNYTDFSAFHDSHDQNTIIRVDVSDPANSEIVSVANGASGFLSVRDLNQSIKTFIVPDEIEMEWETGISPTDPMQKEGDGMAGINGGPMFPKWAWPSPGDRVWVNGQHVYDCGHPAEGINIDGSGDDKDYFRSEIHPARAIASMRDQVIPLPASGGVPVRAVATDLYIHGDGGIANDVLNCDTNFLFKGPQDYRCRPGFKYENGNPVTEYLDRSPIDDDFQFDIHLPPRPFGSSLSVEVTPGPENSITVEPTWHLILDEPGGPKLHVEVDLRNSGADPLDIYARHINAGWVSNLQAPPPVERVHLTLNTMDLHHNLEGDDLPPFDTELPDVKWSQASFFWLNIPSFPGQDAPVGTPARQEWTRLSDFDVPTPTNRLVKHRVFDPLGFHVVTECRTDLNRPNVMEDYAADNFNNDCESGELGFSGLDYDVYLPPTAPALTVRALGYEQDCFDDLFGQRQYHLSDYLPCQLGGANDDPFTTLNAQLQLRSQSIVVLYSTADGDPAGSEAFSYEEAAHGGLRLKTPDYDLYFTLQVFDQGEPVLANPTDEPPVAEANGPYAVDEGGSVPLSSSGSHDPDDDIVFYEWDFNYDGVTFTTDAVGPSPTLSAAALDGPATRQVALRVTDGYGATNIDTATLTVSNLPPTAALGGATVGVPGLAETFVVSATDPAPADVAAGFTFRVNFGDGSTLAVLPGAPRKLAHVYTATGNYTVTVTATDKDGGVSLPATRDIAIQATAVLPDPDDPTRTILYVGGTLSADTIDLTPQGNSAVKVKRNGDSVGPFPLTSRTVIFGLDGDDVITIADSLTAPVIVYAGAGDDRVNGGGGDDILLGEGGQDRLFGGGGRDLLIGGTGADQIVGNGGDDLLIAGTTDFDANVAAVRAVMAEWTRTGVNATYAQRIDHLKNGGGLNTLDGGVTFIQLNDLTVHDDGASDVLTGSAGQDWFFARLDKDRINDVGALEDLEALP